MSKNQQPNDVDALWNELEFEVPIDEGLEGKPNPHIEIVLTEEEKKKAEEKEKAEEEKKAEEKRLAAEAAKKAEEEGGKEKTPEQIEAEKKAAGEAAKQNQTPPKGEGSEFYTALAKKYLEKGKWSDDFSIEVDGEETPISEVEAIDEDMFFQIEDALEAQKEEENKGKFLSLEGVNERKKNIIEIVNAGGDLTKIFKSSEQMQSYLNPFEGIDLDNETVQERVYLNALVNQNKLDQETASLIVEKAKKDLTLDKKVKDYVEQYTQAFDKFVEKKKQDILDEQAEEKKNLRAFKKSLVAKYKEFDLKESLGRKLADSAVNKKDGEFEIDSLYAQKMENPDEAAELILFLTDKQAYLDFKTKEVKAAEHTKVRKVVKLIPRDTKKKVEEKKDKPTNSELEFEVPEV